MRQFRIGSLQWTMGALCTAIGALMLVTPHLFAAALYATLASRLPLVGLLFLVAGIAFIAVCTLPTPDWLCISAHALGSLGVLALALSFVATGHWVASSAFVSLAVVAAAAVPIHHFVQWEEEDRGDADLLPLTLAVSMVAIGLVLVASRGRPSSGIEGLIPALWPLPGAYLMIMGVLLAWAQFSAFPIVDPHRGRTAVYPASGAGLLAVGLLVALPMRIWPAVAYCAGSGLLLCAYPWLGKHLHPVTAHSLQTRLALMLVLTAAVPIIIIVALAGEQQEMSVRSQALLGDRYLANSMAQTVADYVGEYRSAVQILAAQPGLMDLPPQEQSSLLKTYARTYPDASSFTLYGADGSPIARSDDMPADTTIAGYPNDDTLRATGRPATRVVVSPVVHQPIIGIEAPVLGSDGTFRGLVSTALEPGRVAGSLVRGEPQASAAAIYLVDDKGRAIAHPDAQLAGRLADLSTTQPVARFLADQHEAGSMRYTSSAGEQLVGYARVPGLGWGVIIERSEDASLQGVRAGRELALGLLVVVLALVSLAGVVVARYFSEPLLALAHAADEMAAGRSNAPLPKSKLIEVQRLDTAFETMRRRLAERTAEREHAREQLVALSHRLVEVQEDERRAIARELHDEAGQALTALKLRLGLMQREAASPDQAAELEDLKETTDQVMEGLHRLAANLRPASLDRAGLIPALRQYAESIDSRNGLRVDFVATGFPEGPGEASRLPDEVEVTLYRVVQEALTNVVRHAQASQASVLLQRNAGRVLTIIEDNGTGFDPESARQKDRLGLFGMHERVQMLGGSFNVESAPGSGTTVYVELPLTGAACDNQSES